MAIVLCPECGQEISDKAKKCIHCGKVLMEEDEPKKFCAECGQKISVDSHECPFCGCPVEQEKTETNVMAKVTEKAKKFKKPLIFVAIVAVVAIIVGTVINFVGSTLNEDEQLAYQNAVKMKNMMKDPDSFKLYDEMFLLKHFDENGENDFTYTIFKYGGANGYGAIITDEAVFKNGEYIMDYADEADQESIYYMEQLAFKYHFSSYVLTGDNDRWQKVDIDIEKIKNKMGLK